jgi:hypothetical protein
VRGTRCESSLYVWMIACGGESRGRTWKKPILCAPLVNSGRLLPQMRQVLLIVLLRSCCCSRNCENVSTMMPNTMFSRQMLTTAKKRTWWLRPKCRKWGNGSQYL